MVTVLPSGETLKSMGTERRVDLSLVGSTGPSMVVAAWLPFNSSRTSLPPNSVSPTSHGVRSELK